MDGCVKALKAILVFLLLLASSGVNAGYRTDDGEYVTSDCHKFILDDKEQYKNAGITLPWKSAMQLLLYIQKSSL